MAVVATAVTVPGAGAEAASFHRSNSLPAPLGPDVLHLVRGHLPVGGTTPHATSSATAGPALSTNWSGQVATGGTYTSVAGSWTVPTVQPGGNDYSATWIGIDGTSSSTLIQTGTAQESDFGTTAYYPWYELLPNSETPIPHLVEPGDSMTSSITETSTVNSTWSIVLTDVSEQWTFQISVHYVTPGTSAEWIEEAPTVGTQTTLADYGSTTFTGMSVGGPGTAAATYSPIYMIDTLDTEVISWPNAYNPATTSFAVQYGSPTPVITGVSPSSGPTSGDTVVTLSGQYLFAGFEAQFGGGTPTTNDLYLNGDGTLSVASPPGAAGPVDIILSSPDTNSTPTPADQFTYSTSAPRVPHGYWLVGADGGIFSFGSAGFHGSTGNLHLQRPVVGITPTADRKGYWLVATDGGVFAFGDAGFYGSLPGIGIAPAGSGRPRSLNAPIVGMVPSSDDRGYFMVAADGGVFAFGDARFEGSCPGIGGCSGAGVSVLPDSSGQGYWLVTATGHVYTFGNAPSEGSPIEETGGQAIPFPVVSAVRTVDGAGYWILFNNGIVLGFGDASAYEDTNHDTDAYGQVTEANPAAAIFATDDNLGYWIASAGGSVYSFGSARNDGSMAGQHLNAPIIAASGW